MNSLSASARVIYALSACFSLNMIVLLFCPTCICTALMDTNIWLSGAREPVLSNKIEIILKILEKYVINHVCREYMQVCACQV
jgi:hypothetical protein